MFDLRAPSLFLMVAALPLVAGDAPTEAVTLSDALTKGSFGGGVRYRLDYLDQDPSTKDALASTLRLSLAFRTLPFYGFSGYLDLYNNAVVGNDLYNSIQNAGSSNAQDRPVIVDPAGRGVNEGYGRYTNKEWLDTKITVGRQLFTLNDEVFVTASTYRQNNNRFDAASIESHPLPELLVQYAYIWNNQNVLDVGKPMASHVGNLKYSKKGIGGMAAYAVLLDYDYLPNRDVSTFGIRIDGPFKLSDDVSVIYEADVAKQSDAFDNTQNIDADYLMARVGLSFKKWYASVGYRHQSGVSDSSDAPFEGSQIGYPWPWRGNTEQLVFTPTNGLNTIMVWVGGAIPPIPGLSFDLWYFTFDSTENSIAYGSECSAALMYRMPFDPKWWISGMIAQANAGDEGNGTFFDATRAVFAIGYLF